MQSLRLDQLLDDQSVFCDGDWVESKDQDPNGSVRLIQLADIGNGVFKNKSNRFLTADKAKELGCTFLRKGDILIARMPGPLGRACIFPLTGEDCYVTVVDVCIVRPSKKIAGSKFLNYMLNSPHSRAKIESYRSGSTRKRISRRNLAKITFPIVAVPEQNRIVEKIEALFSELDHGVKTLETARQQLKVYRQAVLKHAFEGKLTEQWRRRNVTASGNIYALIKGIERERRDNYEQELIEWNRANTKGIRSAKPKKPFWHDVQATPSPQTPSDWRTISLGNLCDAPRYGTSKKCTYDAAQDAVGVLRIPNLVSGVVDDSDLKYTLLDDVEHDDLGLKENDILIIRSNGSLAIVGTSARVRPADTKHVYAGYLIRVRVNTRSFYSGFIDYFLASPAGRQQIEDFAKSTSGVNNISAKELQAIEVPFCAPEEQNQIVQEIESRLSVVDDLEKTIDDNLKKAEALRQSILKKAFAGELVPAETAQEMTQVASQG